MTSARIIVKDQSQELPLDSFDKFVDNRRPMRPIVTNNNNDGSIWVSIVSYRGN